MKYMISCIFLLLSLNVSNAPLKGNVGETTIIETPAPPVSPEERINDLHVLHPAFRNRVIKFLHECSMKGIKLEVLETYRTPERQDVLRWRGFSMLKGGRSKHQHRLAIDVVPLSNSQYAWDNIGLWNKIGKIGEKHGLKWGGRWRKLYDPGHFEYPISIDSIHTLAIPDTVLIPLNYRYL